jgi:hypothetical protein
MTDLTATLGAIFSFDPHVPDADRTIIQACSDLVAEIGRFFLPMEHLINHLDSIILRSNEEHLHARGPDPAVVIPCDDSDGNCDGEAGNGEEDEVTGGDVRTARHSLKLMPNSEGVIILD